MIYLFVVCFVLFLVILLSIGFAGLSMAIWVPSRKKDLIRIIEVAKIKDDEVFYELGCGNGRVAFFVAKNTKAKVVGIELAWPLYAFCKIKNYFLQLPNLEFKKQDLFEANLSNANLVYIFGMPDKIKDKLRPKLEKELKLGTRIISYAFSFAGWEPIEKNKPDEKSIAIYLYKR